MGESIRASNYRDVILTAKKADLCVVPVNIDWGINMDMTDYINQADKKIPNESVEDYILGFSFGAYISAILSKKKKMKGFIFCSLSPYFKENLKNIPEESKKYFGKKMMASFKKYSFSYNNQSKAWFLIGKKDWPLAIRQAKGSCNKWKGSKKLIVIKDAGHSLKHSNYIKALGRIIKKL